jgi:hypothetical protein
MKLPSSRWRLQVVAAAAAAVFLVPLVIYLRDPPWLGSVSSGLRGWEYNRRDGRRFRWMGGRASFFVPSDSRIVRIPLHALFPRGDSREFIVTIDVNDRPIAALHLPDERWRTVEVRLSDPALRRRRHVRIDLRVNRTYIQGILGVQVGEVTTVGAS